MWSPARTRTMSAESCSMTLRLRRTASAVPRYHSATRPRAMYGWSSLTPPRLRSRSHGRPRPMWSFSERGLYWVRTTTLSMSELTQFDSVKSMIRYLPPKGTAGLARTDERIERRSPSPPARITAIVRFTVGPPGRVANRSTRPRPRRLRGGSRSVPSSTPVSPAATLVARRGRALARQEQAGVHPVANELDGPVEMRPGGPAGHALVGDDLARGHVVARLDPRRVAVVVDVRVPRHEVRRVGDDHDPARVVRAAPGPDHLAGAGGPDRRVHRVGDV